jgi:hypothetical protein
VSLNHQNPLREPRYSSAGLQAAADLPAVNQSWRPLSPAAAREAESTCGGARPWSRTTAPPRPPASSSPAPARGHRPASALVLSHLHVLADEPHGSFRCRSRPPRRHRRPRRAARARCTPPPRSSPEVEEDPGHVKGQNSHLRMWVPHAIGVKPLTSNRIHPKRHGCQ